MSATSRLINAEEAARILRVSRATVYSYVRRDQLTRHPSPQGHGFFLLDRAEVERFTPRRRARACDRPTAVL